MASTFPTSIKEWGDYVGQTQAFAASHTLFPRTLLRSKSIVIHGLAVVPLCADAVEVHIAEMQLRFSVTAIGRLLEVLERHARVLGQHIAVKTHDSHAGGGQRVALLGREGEGGGKCK